MFLKDVKIMLVVLPQQWTFGGIRQKTTKYFLVCIKDTTVSTLISNSIDINL